MQDALSISIVSANYNNAEFLEDFFESVNSSTVLPDELIFVDDASTDNSVYIANLWQSKSTFKIVVVALESNVGYANALNQGIAVSKGEIILRIDTDDFIHPQRIAKEKNFLEQNPGIDLIGSNTFYYNNRRGKVVGISRFPAAHSSIQALFKKGYISISNGSYSARRDIFYAHHYEQTLVPYEEYVLFSKMLIGNVLMANIPELLTYYRIHGQARSFRHFKRNQQGITKHRTLIFGEKTGIVKTILKTLAGYFYWRSLRASDMIGQWFFLAIAFPFKLLDSLDLLKINFLRIFPIARKKGFSKR